MDFVNEDDEELIDIRKKMIKRKNNKSKKSVGVSRRYANEILVPTHEGGGDEYNNDYAAFDEYYSPYSNDGEGGVKFKSKFLAFNHKYDKSWSEPIKGMKFANPQQLKDCLTNYAVARGYPIKFDRNSRHNLLAICAKGRPIRLWANWIQNESNF